MPMSEDDKAELVAYLDGELDEAATQAVEAKLAADPGTRAELDVLKQTWGMLDYLPKASPSPNFTHRTLERLTLENMPAHKTMPMPGRRRTLLAASGWVAAVLLAIGVGYIAATHLWPTTPEAIPESDLPLVKNLPIAEHWRLLENADDLEFVQKLNHPELFGEDPI